MRVIMPILFLMIQQRRIMVLAMLVFEFESMVIEPQA
jgi:hypothetical protein